MRWRNSLFLKIFLWFWIVVFVCMFVATMSFQWLQDDYHRPLQIREQHVLQRIVKNKQPLKLKKRGLWRKLKPGWNVITFKESDLNRIPDDIAEFYEHALEIQHPLWGQEDGLIMMGPLLHRDQIYIAISRHNWKHTIDEGERWLIPLLVVLMVSLLCALLAWHLTKPIRRLQKATKQLGEGDFDTSDLHDNLKRRDELGELSVEFVAMADSLQRLLQSHRQLLRDVSHELRSPLTRLQIALGIARKKDSADLLTSEHDKIERAASQVEGLISQILDLAKLQHGDELALQSQDLKQALSLWVQDAELELANKKLQVNWQVPAAGVQYEFDHVWMQRAFDNVLRNAIRFSPEGGMLDIALKQTSDGIEFSLCDQGPGVPEDKLEEIFEPFTQVDLARDHAAGGYGIGLAMVQRIIRLHGGSVAAENRPQGGFCMRWSIPVHQK